MTKHKSLFLLSCVGVATSIAHTYAQESDQPNILMIMCDDLMHFDGIYKDAPEAITPNLDSLIAQSINFVNAHSIAPVSAPCRASLFTGIYPHTSQNYGFDTWYNNTVLSDCKTIMEMLTENGYNVYGTGKLLHQNRKADFTSYGHNNYGGPLAFDGVSAAYHPNVPSAYASVGPLDGTFASLANIPDVPASGSAPGYTGWYNTQDMVPFRYVSDDDRDLMRDEEHVEWAKDIIADLESGSKDDSKPFFLGVGFSKPHTALVAPQKYFDMYPLEDINMPTYLDGDADDCYLFDNTPDSKGYSHYAAMQSAFPDDVYEGIRMYIQAYLASVTFADHMIGEVLTALAESKYADNTIIIFVSDHGYDFGQKEYMFKNSLWQTSTSVPFVVHYPANASSNGTEVNAPISLIDIYPTLVDLTGFTGTTLKGTSGAPLDGHSIKPFLEDPTTSEWSGGSVSLSIVKNSNGSLYPGSQNYSVRSEKWRYIRYANGSEELYDCEEDPHEWTNLAADSNYEAVKTELFNALCELVPEILEPEAVPDDTVNTEPMPTDIDNLLVNGDFENYDETTGIRLPVSWSVVQDSSNESSVCVATNGVDRTGNLKLGIASTVTNCSASQTITVTPNKTYKIGGYCYYSGTPTTYTYAEIYVEDSEGNSVLSYPISVTAGTICNNPEDGDYSIVRMTEFASATSEVTVHLKNNGIDKLIRFDNMAVWESDDVVVEDEEDPSSTMLYTQQSDLFKVVGQYIEVAHAENIESVAIYAASGKMLKYSSIAQGRVEISELPSGVYILHASMCDEAPQSFRFTK